MLTVALMHFLEFGSECIEYLSEYF